MDEEYYFKDFEHRRKGRTTVVYTVAKFNYRRYPEAVYEVDPGGRWGWSCTCPQGEKASYFRSEAECKHVRLVQEWVRAGKPSPFDRFAPERAASASAGTTFLEDPEIRRIIDGLP